MLIGHSDLWQLAFILTLCVYLCLRLCLSVTVLLLLQVMSLPGA